jgi:hypothetical protein
LVDDPDINETIPMKKTAMAIILSVFSLTLFSQNYGSFQPMQPIEKTACITIGILQGGGSLIGMDFEKLLSKKFGVQLGMGYIGFGGGINYHFKPSISSSFISLQYWHQGIGETYTQSLLGPSFVFRGKKWFTAQIGVGAALEKGPAFPEDKEQPPVMLLYSIGGYIPL